MCLWRSREKVYYECKVPAEPGSQLCIFHKCVKKSIERFKSEFAKQIHQQDSTDNVNPRFDFTGYVFPVGVSTWYARALLSESNGGAPVVELPMTINGDVTFDEADIYGILGLAGATISGELTIKSAEIRGELSMHSAKIEKSLVIEATRVRGRMSSSMVECPFCLLIDSQVDGDVDFSSARIMENIRLMNALIGGSARFPNARVGGDLTFHGSSIGEGIHLHGSQIGGDLIIPVGKIPGRADFSMAQIGRFLDLSGVSIEGTGSFEHCDARGIILPQDRPTMRGWWRGQSGLDFANPQTASSFWRFARYVMEKEGRREDADVAHYLERVWHWRALRMSVSRECKPERKSEQDELVPEQLNLPLRWRNARSRKAMVPATVRDLARRDLIRILWVLDYVFLRLPTAYGGSIGRLFVTWATLILGFALLYALLGFAGLQPLVRVTASGQLDAASLGDALYFSVVTFTTLGYGDVRPSQGLASGLAATEAVLGGIVIALTVLVIGRKFMR